MKKRKSQKEIESLKKKILMKRKKLFFEKEIESPEK